MESEQGQLFSQLTKERLRIPKVEDHNILLANESQEEALSLTYYVTQFI